MHLAIPIDNNEVPTEEGINNAASKDESVFLDTQTEKTGTSFSEYSNVFIQTNEFLHLISHSNKNVLLYFIEKKWLTWKQSQFEKHKSLGCMESNNEHYSGR